MDNKSPSEVAHCARMAAVMEASAEKPGNVTPTKGFRDLEYRHFLEAAERLEPFIERAAREGEDARVGRLIFDATSDERNVNFGVMLLFVPLAAARGGSTRRLLRSLTVEDSEWMIRAMQKGKLGGMELKDKSLPRYDILSPGVFEVVREESLTPIKLMKLSQPYDTIARELVGDYPISRGISGRIEADPESIVDEYLRTLAKHPDTLIARKTDLKEARRVSGMAKEVLEGGMSREDFDAYLRSRGNSLNPGTTADLIATGLFLKLLSN